jgi:hypothetical protein
VCLQEHATWRKEVGMMVQVLWLMNLMADSARRGNTDEKSGAMTRAGRVRFYEAVQKVALYSLY